MTEDELYDIHHEHDCIALMAQETSGFSHVSDVPITNPDVQFFVDGSRSIGEDGRFYTGYAQHEVVKAEPLPPHVSAQEAELRALIEALRGAEGKRGNIYTDSRYAFGVAHDYGPIWKARDFLTSAGTPIKHGHLIKELMEALMLPDEVAIIKVRAHTKLDTEEARGNDKADRAAKEAARKPRERETPSPLLTMVSTENNQMDLSILQALTRQATGKEKRSWSKAGAREADGLWRIKMRVCLPRSLYPMMAQAAHGPTHLSKNAMCALIDRQWFAPGFTTIAAKLAQSCLTCAQYNTGSVVKVPQKHTPKALYPFQRLQIDFIQLPKVSTYEYVLVCVDLFSGWVEAFPMARANAKQTARKLMSEIFSRFGLPETIESDRGTHFTGEVMQNAMQMLGVTQAFHTPYHPQASGKVERLNGTLKLKIQKACEELGKPWTECLPVALYSIRYTPNRKTKLSPFEILFGSAPRLGLYFPQTLQLQCDSITSYVQSLQKRLSVVHKQVYDSIPDPDSREGAYSLQPGDWVVVKRHTRRPLEPRFDGPFQVLLITATSVKLEGKPNWIHASHCKVVERKDDRPSDDVGDPDPKKQDLSNHQ
ncbi:protein NYNRIN-like [Dendropsophus ebraccatus]|uniref:protein NYNRIN-like n=1 Tax=Dendropsophus ebraccatus TaxID=150705 RepID=UPI00383198ED